MLCTVAAVLALVFGLCFTQGCGSGNGGPAPAGSAQAAAERFAGSLETQDTQSLSALFPASYCYDGTGEAGGASPVPGFGFWGAQGTTTVDVTDVEQNGTSATARVTITFTGFLSDFGGVDGGGGTNNGGGETGLGVEPPPPPAATDPGQDSGSGDGAAGGNEDLAPSPPPTPFSLRSVKGEQLSATPVTYTAVYLLRLELINEAWMIVGLRQLQSTSTVGSGAQAPVLRDLVARAEGDANPPTATPAIDPRTIVEVSGSVTGSTDESVYARAGYMWGSLPITGDTYQGRLRAPRRPGLYVLEVGAGYQSPDGGAYGYSTLSIELTVNDVPGAGLQFSVADGVSLPAGLEDWLRNAATAFYNGETVDPSQYVSPQYSYDGGDFYSTLWRLPFMFSPESDLTVRVTEAGVENGSQYVVLEFTQTMEDLWGWAYGGTDPSRPGGTTGGGGDGNGGEPAPLYARAMQDAPGTGLNQLERVTTGTARLELEGSGDAWLITAARPLDVTITDGTGPSLAFDGPVTVNGTDAPAVVGAADLAVAGSIAGQADYGQASTGDSWADLTATSGAFTADLKAPYSRGRWLVWVTASAWTDQGSTFIGRTVEVDVTQDAPTPTFTVGSGVDVSADARATLDAWLAAMFLYSQDRIEAVYSPNYAYDGRTRDNVLNQPRLYAYHADFTRAEITGVTVGGDTTQVALELVFDGQEQWFQLWPETGPVEGGDGVRSRQNSDMGQWIARTRVAMTLKLGADDLIVAERIDSGHSGPVDTDALTLTGLTVNGEAPGTVAAGAEATVAATAGGADSTTGSVRLGGSVAFNVGTSGAVTAPTVPGIYLAEVVVTTYPAEWGVMQNDSGGGTDASPPYYGMPECAVVGAEVTVQ